MENIREWILNNDSGSDSGSGDGIGYGSGSDSGSGDGIGYGYGDGSGDGSGDGYGYGYGYGDGIGAFEGKEVYLIDNVMTIIDLVKDSFAKGYIINSDLTLTQCFIAKGDGYFAHGETLKEARDALRKKIFENMDSEQAIDEFMKKFNKGEKYPGTDFFEWHHYLTGSCLMGRKAFVKNKGLNIDDMYTVEEFISLCEDEYGSDIIKQLKDRWEKERR